MKSIIGTKVGMTRIFDDAGRDYPVTVINVGPCTVSQVKTEQTDGYSSVQLAYGERKVKNMTKPVLGHLNKAGLKSARVMKEFPLSGEVNVGDVVTAEIFAAGDSLKITGRTKGRGFTGVMKRHGFHGGHASHGKKDQLRAGGSIGASSDPSRVFPGKKMPGHHGNQIQTNPNVKVVKVDTEAGQIFVLGQVPGAKNGTLFLTKQS